MIKRLRVLPTFVLVSLCAGAVVCGQVGPTMTKEERSQIESDIAGVDQDIAAAEQENARYAGGLVKSFIELRLATLKQTKAMLEQRSKAGRNAINLRYTVDGKQFSLPASAKDELASIEQELKSTEAQIAQQQAEADRYSGGLVQAMSLATVATTRQTLAMLQQKRLALRYALPQFVGFASQSAAPPTQGTRAVPVPQQQPVAGPATPDDWEIVEVDARVTEQNDTWWKYAWKLTLRNKGSQPKAFRATIEFQDKDGFVVDDDDADDPLIVAAGATESFTGYDLITTGSATKIAKTIAKVRPAR